MGWATASATSNAATIRDPRRTRLRIMLFLLLAAALMTLATWLDPAAEAWAVRHWPTVRDRDWLSSLRSLGWAPVWLGVAVMLLMIDRRTLRGRGAPLSLIARRAVLLTLPVLLAGGAAEVVKLLVRRLRPGHDLGVYHFRPWEWPFWNGIGLGFPSSHTAVAFAAAAVLGRMYPAIRWLTLVAAGGCLLARVLSHAHYLSDAVAGALIGEASAATIWAWHCYNQRRLRDPRVGEAPRLPCDTPS